MNYSHTITAVIVGAGQRSIHSYGPYALEYPGELKFVAIAEPDVYRREHFANIHSIPPERQFATWEDLLAQGQIADVLFNMTQDQLHYTPSIAALETGYDVLLEKPMAIHLADCVDLVRKAERTGRLLQVCYVLRYTPFFSIIHQILTSGRLGDIITVEHRENMIYWHMAHSFVRGNWRNSITSCPMILSKCCHNLDILYWNVNRRVERLHSFGSLIHFQPSYAPISAPLRCTDGCPVADQCPFDAQRLYLNPFNTSWPVSTISQDLSLETRRRALEIGPYGCCVYHCDNNVVDHQTVNIEFEGGISAVMLLHGHSHEESRTMRYDGTRATLRAKFNNMSSQIEIHDHVTNRREDIVISPAKDHHGNIDFGVVQNFLRAVRGEEKALTDSSEVLESHLMAFAAEESRLTGTVVDMNDLRQYTEISMRTK